MISIPMLLLILQVWVAMLTLRILKTVLLNLKSKSSLVVGEMGLLLNYLVEKLKN